MKTVLANFTGIALLYKNKIFILFLGIFLFSGCAGEKEGIVTFSVGGAPNELNFWETLISEFQKEKGIEVSIMRQPTDTDQRRQGLVISLKSRKSDPDVFLMDVAWLAQFAASDWLQGLEDFVKRDNVNQDVFFGKVLNLADRYKGKLVGLPVYIDGGMLYYRRDLLERYGIDGPPETWDELIEYSAKIQKDLRKVNPAFYGFVWQGAQYEGLVCNFLEFAVSNGGGIIFRNDKILLNLPENTSALRLMYDLINRYRISPPNIFTEMKEEEVRMFFEKGNALFERNWPYAWALHNKPDSPVKGKVGIAPLPHFKGGKSVSTLGGWHIGMSKYSDVKEIGWELIKFITSYSIQKRLAMELGWNPGRRDLYSDRDLLKKLPHFVNLREVFENAYPRPLLPYYTQISDILQRYINAALSGKLSPEQALASAERDVQKVSERYREVHRD